VLFGGYEDVYNINFLHLSYKFVNSRSFNQYALLIDAANGLNLLKIPRSSQEQ